MSENNNIPEVDYSDVKADLETENLELKKQLQESQAFVEKLQNLYNKVLELYLFNK